MAINYPILRESNFKFRLYKLIGKVLSVVRKLYRKIFHTHINDEISAKEFEYKDQGSSDLIKSRLLDNEPVMICRFGCFELNCVANYIRQPRPLYKNAYDFVRDKIDYFWWGKIFENMAINAGFFPASFPLIEKFCRLMLEDMNYVDILGSWLKEEDLFKNELSNAIKIKLSDLEPFHHNDPWSEALKGKTVLVIHPFEDSIQKQYKKREFLFDDKRMLPDFELKTLKAVQSIANNKTEFDDWFAALDYMKGKITDTAFDIAIIGCGAYGFPLAAHVKRMGKKAVHLGGATQVLFGIKGKRWEGNATLSKHINSYWVNPLPSEYPQDFTKVEKGCYW
jgi:hypothetical protein